jgi:phage tail sheath protein FI
MIGVHLLDAVPTFNLLAVPGETDPGMVAELQAYCAKRSAFPIADSAIDSTFATLQNGPDSRMTGANAINSAFYFPWLNALDAQQNVARPFPPSGFVAGLYAEIDSSSGVWGTPAGIHVKLTGQLAPVLSLTDPQLAALSAHAVNCIRHIAQFDDVVWGNRTLGGSDQAGSKFMYVSVRRLFFYIEQSLSIGTQWAEFEPNNEQLWAQLRSSVVAFMPRPHDRAGLFRHLRCRK